MTKQKLTMKQIEQEGKPVIERIIRKVTLRTLHTVTDPCNCQIMDLLPSNQDDIQEAFGWSQSQLNRRLATLESAHLIHRYNTGNVEKTQLGRCTLNVIKQIEKDVMKVLPDVV